MKKIKIIQINSVSSSLIVENFEEDIKKGWYAQIAYQLKKFNGKLDVECWTLEKQYSKKKDFLFNNIKFRIFPTNLSLRHSMEVSIDLIKDLKKEIKLAEKDNYNLILHFHEYHMWQMYTSLFLFKKSKNVKIFAQHHGGRSPFQNLMRYNRLFLVFPLILLMQLCEKYLFKKIDTFYALSLDEINYLKKYAPNSKIKFQTMGIEDIYFEKLDKYIARKKLSLDLTKKYILYLGRIKTTKGIKELFDAMHFINAELLLIGEGVDSEKYKNYVIEQNLYNIKFLDAIYGDKKLLYLSACDCLILPSYTEGAPVVIMEAIARNLPVVVTNVGGVSIMIKDNREGLFIKPYSTDEIIIAINKVLKWKKKDIRKYAEKYRWKKIIKSTLDDYLK